jgi:hypothetical protein
MNTYQEYIKGEFEEFRGSHNSKVNLAIHILSGILYKSSLNCLVGEKTVFLYLVFLLISIPDSKMASILSCMSIYMGSQYISENRYLVIYFLFGCFVLPEISHFLTKEKTVLNVNNATIQKVATNIAFFLPFSIHQFSGILRKIKND